jgi:hypothetical protein
LDFAVIVNLSMTARSTLAAVAFGLAMIVSASAQDLRDRELKPAIDFATIEMPVQIVSIKLKGTDVAPGEKTKGDDDWLKGVSFTVKNISDKPIAYVAIGLLFEPPPVAGRPRVVVFILSYGVDYSRGVPRNGSSPPPIQPDQTVDLVLTNERYPNFLQILGMGEMPLGFDVVPYYVERVLFDDDPNIIWEAGFLKRQNPAAIQRFEIIEKYKLPTKQ